jgi:hypothetical protein
MNKAAYSPAHEFNSILYIQEHSTGINQQYQAEKKWKGFHLDGNGRSHTDWKSLKYLN